MTLILRGRRFGFSLEEIRQWLLIYRQKGTATQMKAWVDLADRQLAALHQQRADLDTAIADLKSLRDGALDASLTSRQCKSDVTYHLR